LGNSANDIECSQIEYRVLGRCSGKEGEKNQSEILVTNLLGKNVFTSTKKEVRAGFFGQVMIASSLHQTIFNLLIIK